MGTWLRMRGFHEKIPHLVEGHVLAKRYLVSADETYAANLSKASTRTLAYQGGKMTAEEMKIFEQVPGFETHHDRIRAALVRPPRTADMCFSQTFKREGNVI